MDPATQFGICLELLLKIVLVAMEGQPQDVREALWRRHLEALEKADGLLERLAKLIGLDQ